MGGREGGRGVEREGGEREGEREVEGGRGVERVMKLRGREEGVRDGREREK